MELSGIPVNLFHSLKQFGFSEYCKKFLFEDNRFRNRKIGLAFANENSEFILFFIEHTALDAVIVKELNYLFDAMTNGFVEQLGQFFNSNPELKAQYQQICIEIGEPIPPVLNS